MYYVAIIRGRDREGIPYLCTSLPELSRATDIKVGTLRYQFGKRGRDYYGSSDPWIDIWAVRRLNKIKRPQYDKPAYNRKKK